MTQPHKHTQEQAYEWHDLNAYGHLSEEAFLAYVDVNCYATESLTELFKTASEAYAGKFESFAELAYSFVDDGLYGDIPESLQNYIDYEAIGRDLRLSGDYFENKGHYFNNNV